MNTKNTSRLPDIMAERGFTVERLVESTGVCKQTIIRLRRDQIGTAKIDTLQKIAKTLQVTVDDLFSTPSGLS